MDWLLNWLCLTPPMAVIWQSWWIVGTLRGVLLGSVSAMVATAGNSAGAS